CGAALREQYRTPPQSFTRLDHGWVLRPPKNFASTPLRFPVLDSGLRSTHVAGASIEDRPDGIDVNCLKGDLWKVQKYNLQKPYLITAPTVPVPYGSKPDA